MKKLLLTIATATHLLFGGAACDTAIQNVKSIQNETLGYAIKNPASMKKLDAQMTKILLKGIEANKAVLETCELNTTEKIEYLKNIQSGERLLNDLR